MTNKDISWVDEYDELIQVLGDHEDLCLEMGEQLTLLQERINKLESELKLLKETYNVKI